MKHLKAIFGNDTRQFGMIFALIALIVLFQVMTDGLLLTPTNVINLFQGNSYILVLAIGMIGLSFLLDRGPGWRKTILEGKASV